MTLVDSCIIVDVTKNDEWSEASWSSIKERSKVGRLFAPDVVYAEVCYGYKNKRHVDTLFSELGIEVVPLGRTALFRASRAFEAFLAIRKATSNPSSIPKRILPDFYIGALAEEEGIPLLTRDTKRNWKNYFPSLNLLIP